MGKRYPGRNKARRERRKARREADDKVMRAIMKTMDRLELYTKTRLIINEMMEAVGKVEGSTYWYNK